MGDPSGESSEKGRRRKRRNKSRATDNAKSADSDDEDHRKGNPIEPALDHDRKDNDGDVDDEALDASDNGDHGDEANAGSDYDDDGGEQDTEDAGGSGEAEGSTKKRKRKRKRKSKSATNPSGGVSNGGTKADATSATSATSDAPKLQSIEHTVFIEGLPFTSSEDDVRSFFTSLGCNDVLELRLPRWQDSGRLRGFGHVVFASKETRTRAISDEVNGKELGGRYITVKKPNPPRPGTTAGASLGAGGGGVRKQPEGCRTVYVRNLPYEATEEHIQESFRVCGKIVEGGVRVVRNHVNGHSKGFGYVEYKNEEGALAAVQKAVKPFGLQVLGRPVFVDYDEGSIKGSFRNREGVLWTKEHGSSGRGRGGQTRGGRVGGRGGGRGMRGLR